MAATSSVKPSGQRARDIMQGAVRTVDPDMSLVDFERLLLSERIGGAPVVDKGEVVGVVSRSDIIRILSLEQSIAEVQSRAYDHKSEVSERRAMELIGGHVGQRMQELKVRDAMTEVRATVGPDASLREVAQAMVNQKVHRVLVMEDGKLLGLVSRLELVRLIENGTLK